MRNPFRRKRKLLISFAIERGYGKAIFEVNEKLTADLLKDFTSIFEVEHNLKKDSAVILFFNLL